MLTKSEQEFQNFLAWWNISHILFPSLDKKEGWCAWQTMRAHHWIDYTDIVKDEEERNSNQA